MASAARFLHPDALVSTDWLEAHLADPNLRIFDCTTYLIYETGTGRPYRVESGRKDYEGGHIPGSGFLDLQGELSDTSAPTNFMMLPPGELASRFAAKGIGDCTRVVLYSRKATQWATQLDSQIANDLAASGHEVSVVELAPQLLDLKLQRVYQLRVLVLVHHRHVHDLLGLVRVPGRVRGGALGAIKGH